MGTAAPYEMPDSTICLTGHAASRMGSRRISQSDVAIVILGALPEGEKFPHTA